eukprot:NODE_894_length_1108_cov_24.119924_g730_i0.p6 GENE.NODE_894_length_1108_cov_24.119924_g730_i0~~NODE_894_length_1108_cov_24.119924_g730_i0.p6  ORF type:complete len:62 (+),score=4.15 NODE_894_length_1108_cov_24.119924_g730_i0:749-934(+)
MGWMTIGPHLLQPPEEHPSICGKTSTLACRSISQHQRRSLQLDGRQPAAMPDAMANPAETI